MRNPVTHLPTEPLGAEHGDQRAAAGPQQSIDLFLGGVQFGPHRPEAPVGHDDAEGGLGVPVIANQNLAGCHHRDAGNGGDAIEIDKRQGGAEAGIDQQPVQPRRLKLARQSAVDGRQDTEQDEGHQDGQKGKHGARGLAPQAGQDHGKIFHRDSASAGGIICQIGRGVNVRFAS